MKHVRFLAPIVAAFAITLALGGSAKAADYTNSHLMDDQVFDNVGSLTQSQIDDFLQARTGPFTKLGTASPCLSGYSNINFRWDGTDWYYGDNTRKGNSTGWVSQSFTWNTAWGPANIPASQIIYKAAQMWGLNPQVIIATLQKEESLITGTSCDTWRYNSAMGYACPDSGGCNAAYAGFSRQVLWGSWQLKFNKERSNGNTAWDDDGSITYGGFMTQGNRRRCSTCTLNFYDGYATIDGQTIYLENGTTASLYTYTPHLGQSFPRIFEGWFGSVLIPSWSSSVVSITYGRGSSTIPLTQSDLITVVAKNTGTATWRNSGSNPVRLGVTSPFGRQSPFYDGSSWQGPLTPALLQESSVVPGSNGTFIFSVQAARLGSFSEHFNLVAENITWFNNADVVIPFTVSSPSFTTQIVSQSSVASGAGSNVTLNHDASTSLTVVMKNTGNVTWYNYGVAPVRIATSPAGRQSQFKNASWIGPYTPGQLQQSSVAPGANGTFVFNVTAPGPGTYNEAFLTYAENYAFMNDTGLAFTFTVPPDYANQAVSQSSIVGGTTNNTSSLTLRKGQSATLSFTVKNTGPRTWTNSGNNPIRIATWPFLRQSTMRDSSWIGPYTPGQLQQSSVAPGANGTFTFQITAPNTSGVFHESFLLYAENLAFMNDSGLAFDITVQPDYQAQLVSQSWSTGGISQSGSTPTIPHGTVGRLTVVLKNTGSRTWSNSGNNPVRLGTWPFLRQSQFIDSSWIGIYIPAQLEEASVAPGQNGTFNFFVDAPASTGTYTEGLIPYAENAAFMDDIGLAFTITVN